MNVLPLQPMQLKPISWIQMSKRLYNFWTIANKNGHCNLVSRPTLIHQQYECTLSFLFTGYGTSFDRKIMSGPAFKWLLFHSRDKP